jgi:hypothetical protein
MKRDRSYTFTHICRVAGNSIFMPLLGIGVGHLYYFLVEIAPAQANFEVARSALRGAANPHLY